MNYIDYFKKVKIIRQAYDFTKSKFDNIKLQNKFKYTGEFKNRKKDSKYLCIVLAGYKEFLYDDVFGRLQKFEKEDMDICVISSGIYSQKLDKICEQNSWSYLSTEENHVSLVQNVAISLHPKAEFIFKLDEDIFITNNYFENMLEAYSEAEHGYYSPGVLAPLIPVNGYGHMRILEKLNLIEYYNNFFEVPKVMAGGHRKVESDANVAKFFWGEGDHIPSIDILNERFSKEIKIQNPCSIRFSIGAILFKRDFWKEIGYFSVEHKGNSLGKDEAELCGKCLLLSRPLMVTENVVVGHLSFGRQNDKMFEYYHSNREKFSIPK